MRRAGLAFLMLYSALGLAMSLGVHLMAAFGEPLGGNPLFFALHAGIFPLWLPIGLIANKMTGGSYFGGGRKFDWKPCSIARRPSCGT